MQIEKALERAIHDSKVRASSNRKFYELFSLMYGDEATELIAEYDDIVEPLEYGNGTISLSTIENLIKSGMRK